MRSWAQWSLVRNEVWYAVKVCTQRGLVRIEAEQAMEFSTLNGVCLEMEFVPQWSLFRNGVLFEMEFSD